MIWPDEKYGGLGDNDFRYEQIVIEETTRAGCGDWFNSLHSRLVRFLPKCVSGDTILAIAMTEPDFGSDLSSMRSTLRDEGDHLVLNGSKTYISNGINADVILVAAKPEGAESSHAMTIVIVERGMEGLM